MIYASYLNKRKNVLRFNVIKEVTNKTFYLFNITMKGLNDYKIEYAFKNNTKEVFNYSELITETELKEVCNKTYNKYFNGAE